jgi:hypothetical protein
MHIVQYHNFEGKNTWTKPKRARSKPTIRRRRRAGAAADARPRHDPGPDQETVPEAGREADPAAGRKPPRKGDRVVRPPSHAPEASQSPGAGGKGPSPDPRVDREGGDQGLGRGKKLSLFSFLELPTYPRYTRDNLEIKKVLISMKNPLTYQIMRFSSIKS